MKRQKSKKNKSSKTGSYNQRLQNKKKARRLAVSKAKKELRMGWDPKYKATILQRRADYLKVLKKGAWE